MNYGQQEKMETPYQRAQQVWDQRIGNARVQAANWRWFALILLGINAMLGAFLFIQSGRSNIVPYIIEVDAGKARPVALARVYEPEELTIRYFLKNLVQNLRSLPLDPAVIKKNWTEAYNSLSIEAAKLLEYELKKSNPMDEAGKISKIVAVHNVLSLSKDSYQVDWQESIHDTDGRQIGLSEHRGIFNLEIIPPQNEGDIQKNPLGIFVKHFSWQVLKG